MNLKTLLFAVILSLGMFSLPMTASAGHRHYRHSSHGYNCQRGYSGGYGHHYYAPRVRNYAYYGNSYGRECYGNNYYGSGYRNAGYYGGGYNGGGYYGSGISVRVGPLVIHSGSPYGRCRH